MEENEFDWNSFTSVLFAGELASLSSSSTISRKNPMKVIKRPRSESSRDECAMKKRRMEKTTSTCVATDGGRTSRKKTDKFKLVQAETRNET